jgi:hypothetical protein
MRWLQTLRQNKAAKLYARALPTQLWERYGASKSYTAAQIEATIKALQLDRRYTAFAYAAFRPEEDFEAVRPRLPLPMTHAEARALFDRHRVSRPFSAEQYVQVRLPEG